MIGPDSPVEAQGPILLAPEVLPEKIFGDEKKGGDIVFHERQQVQRSLEQELPEFRGQRNEHMEIEQHEQKFEPVHALQEGAEIGMAEVHCMAVDVIETADVVHGYPS